MVPRRARLRLRNGEHHIIRDEVGVRTPCSSEELTLVVLVEERLWVGDLWLDVG